MREMPNLVRAVALALLCTLAFLPLPPSTARAWPIQDGALKEDGPPREAGTFREPDLVELRRLDDSIKLDVRYATPNNFAGRAVYTEARAFLQRPAAEALVRAGRALGSTATASRSSTATARGRSPRSSGTSRPPTRSSSSPTRRRARATTAAAPLT